MLKKIRLKNFKLHEDTTIEASRINVFIGPNNSGKSSIFQALVSLRQAESWGGANFCYDAIKQPARTQPPYAHSADLLLETGPFEELVGRGSSGITVELDGFVRPEGALEVHGSFSAAFELRIERNELTFHKGELRSPPGKFQWQFIRGAAPQAIPGVTVDGFNFHLATTDRFSLVSLGGWSGSGNGAVVGNDAFFRAKSMAEATAQIPSAMLRSVRPVYPLRGFEEWGYPLPERKPEGTYLLSLGDRAVALAALLAYDRDLEEKISGILVEVLNIRVKARLIEGKRATVWAEPADRSRPETLFLNEGSGTNQLPFILVPIAQASSGDSVLLSEPEAHLHPKLQSELAGMILKLFRFAGGELQFFIETHSEHVLHTILNAVAKGELKPEDVALYYFENKNGVAEASKREIDRHGQVDGGLPGFFEQSLVELSEYLKALSKP